MRGAEKRHISRTHASQRKTRCDKKKDVKPTLRIDLKDAIYRLAYMTQKPVKEVCEYMIEFAIRDSFVIEKLSVAFRRDVRFDDTIFRGNVNSVRFDRFEKGHCERLTMRLRQNTYEHVVIFAYALDLNPTRVCAIILDICMHYSRFLNSFIQHYLKSELTPNQLHELKQILKYINNNVDEEMTVAPLLSAILNEVNAPIKISEAVDDFLINHWRDDK